MASYGTLDVAAREVRTRQARREMVIVSLTVQARQKAGQEGAGVRSDERDACQDAIRRTSLATAEAELLETMTGRAGTVNSSTLRDLNSYIAEAGGCD